MNKLKFSALAAILLVVVFVSCEEEFTTIGEGLVGAEPFETSNTVIYSVTAVNKKLDAVQTNKLSVYQLGVFNDSIYGKTEARISSQLQLSDSNPTFGAFSQKDEDESTGSAFQENETVTKVSLYIPYFIDGLVADQEGTVDDFDETSTEPRRFQLDSIYGNQSASFNLKVEELTYFLRDLDPNTGFQEAQEYFSTQEFSPTFTNEVLLDSILTISDKEILTIPEEDDPDTEVNEKETASRRRNPGIFVSLNIDFFQENIIDKEGSNELLNASNFKEFMRGIHLSITPSTGQELLLLLDFTNAEIEITYEHDVVDSDEKDEKTVVLNLLTGGATSPVVGNAVNTFINDQYPTEILSRFDASIENTSRIYLKGGAGSYAEINLFDDGDLAEIKANNWIITEANLVFSVDEEAVNGSIIPPRLYLFNAETNEPLYVIQTENSISSTPLGVFQNYDGLLDDSDPNNLKYTIRITEYINTLIAEGESANVTLGLTVSPDIRITEAKNAMLSGDIEKEIPIAPVMTPLGTVLHGSSSEIDAKKLKLQIFYTQTN